MITSGDNHSPTYERKWKVIKFPNIATDDVANQFFFNQ